MWLTVSRFFLFRICGTGTEVSCHLDRSKPIAPTGKCKRQLVALIGGQVSRCRIVLKTIPLIVVAFVLWLCDDPVAKTVKTLRFWLRTVGDVFKGTHQQQQRCKPVTDVILILIRTLQFE